MLRVWRGDSAVGRPLPLLRRLEHVSSEHRAPRSSIDEFFSKSVVKSRGLHTSAMLIRVAKHHRDAGVQYLVRLAAVVVREGGGGGGGGGVAAARSAGAGAGGSTGSWTPPPMEPAVGMAAGSGARSFAQRRQWVEGSDRECVLFMLTLLAGGERICMTACNDGQPI